MATLLLSAAGSALGAGFGGTVLGLSGAVIGRAVGATLGRVIDQKILGGGSDAVEIGRIDRFRLMGASDGAAVAQVFGRMRVSGQVIWATRFQESSRTQGGGKGVPRPETTTYSYSISLAVALCAGEITGIGRIWADGAEIAPGTLNLRVYTGSESQLPDPRIEAVEGADAAPAYRGIAYVVIEDLDLGRFGNRVPQLSFEVIRPAQGALADQVTTLQEAVRGVALIPGTGEFALATTPVHYGAGDDATRSANMNSARETPDLLASLHNLETDLPKCGSVSLVVSWFGNDLRCGQCEVQPKVEQLQEEGRGQVWRAGGIDRAAAQVVPQVSGASIYGGTPSDASVIQAIRAIRASGREVMFYPFILMEQLAGNGRADPWSDAADQPDLPWRGRITLNRAPGQAGSSDRSAAAAAEVAAFFGSAQPGHFATTGETVTYGGPAEWRYRRFILHYAHLCAAAGGVDAFCIGSEMVALTQIRGAGDSFPAVVALRQLAAEVRAILGPGTKISYAADWSEYFGYHVDGNVYFHLDPLWSDPNIDFIGIDNYMPLADWRDGDRHADAGWGSVHDLGYLKANIAGGEGFDWYYDSAEAADAQIRTPITDGAHDEPWVFRYKDLRSWWSLPHHNRINGERLTQPTDWVPGSKPIRFTEYGCAAIDKGANQPNKFLDPKSSESMLPRYSSGRRDDLMQMQYLIAMAEFWTDPAHNPASTLYSGRMVDWARAHAWAWDARPFPAFPSRSDIWTDGDNYARGHWLTGRASSQPLAAVVAELCEKAGLTQIDVTGLRGVVRGYVNEDVGPARARLQSLMLAYGFDAVDRGGTLQFRMRTGRPVATLDPARLALAPDLSAVTEATRSPEVELAGRVMISHYEAAGDYEMRQAEARLADDQNLGIAQTDLALALTGSEGVTIAERWLAEARLARESLRFALPPSLSHIGAGDVVTHAGTHYRIDRVDQAETLMVEALRTDPSVYRPGDFPEEPVAPRAFVPPLPVYPVFLDLPLLTGDEAPHAPHLAISARPWRGPVTLWSSDEDAGYRPNLSVTVSATVGRTLTPLAAAAPGRWDRGPALRVRLGSGVLTSAGQRAVLNGANALAIGNPDTDIWEVLQFARADLVGPQTYDLSLRLRAQAGTDGIMPAVWPVGSQIVLLDRALQQIDLAASARGLARHYRVGLSARGTDDPTVVRVERAFAGVGLRPYAPVHLRMTENGGDLTFTWVRRTRIDGDSWLSPEVPLGEDRELYQIELWQGGTRLRSVQVPQPGWTYTAAERAADGVAGTVTVEVAQVSARFGAGPAARRDVLL